MKASEARKKAFDKVGKSYEEGLKKAFDIVYSAIDEAAGQGILEISMSGSSVLKYFDELKSYYVKSTVIELIRTRLIEDGYHVDIERLNISSDKWIDISW